MTDEDPIEATLVRACGVGEGDAEAVKEGLCSMVGVLYLTLDVSPGFRRGSEGVQNGGILTCRSWSPENGGYQ